MLGFFPLSHLSKFISSKCFNDFIKKTDDFFSTIRFLTITYISICVGIFDRRSHGVPPAFDYDLPSAGSARTPKVNPTVLWFVNHHTRLETSLEGWLNFFVMRTTGPTHFYESGLLVLIGFRNFITWGGGWTNLGKKRPVPLVPTNLGFCTILCDNFGISEKMIHQVGGVTCLCFLDSQSDCFKTWKVTSKQWSARIIGIWTSAYGL